MLLHGKPATTFSIRRTQHIDCPRFASSNRYRGGRRLISILLKNPPFILREPQDERRGIDNVKNSVHAETCMRDVEAHRECPISDTMVEILAIESRRHFDGKPNIYPSGL